MQEFSCEYGNIVLHDGMRDGIFCANRHHVFCRELLDAQMYDVCGVGMSFRDSFSSWQKVMFFIPKSIWVDKLPLLKQQMDNIALN